MTIIAGYLSPSGVLFAADTKQTVTGFMQMEAGKIFPRAYDSGGKSVFVLSGHVHMAKMLIQHCERELSNLSTEQFTLDNCRSVIERTLAADYATHVYPHPEPRQAVEFLIGLYSAADQAAYFLSAEETSVNRLYGYDCRGAGAYLGHFLLRETLKKSRRQGGIFLSDVERVLLVTHDMITAFHLVKSYDENCGRSTDLIWLGSDARMSPVCRLPDKDYSYPETKKLKPMMESLLGRNLDREFSVILPFRGRIPKELRQARKRVQKHPKRGRKSRPPSQE